MTRSISVSWILLVALSFSAGCVGTKSKFPLSLLETAKAEPGAVGTWLASDGEHKMMLKIDEAGDQFPKNLLKLSIVETDGDQFVGYLYITQMANEKSGDGPRKDVHCVNAITLTTDDELTKWEGEKIESYELFAYHLDGDVMQLYTADEKFLRLAIQSGQLSAEIEPADDFGFIEEETPDLVISEPTDRMNKFFHSNFDKIFPKPTISMKRQ